MKLVLRAVIEWLAGALEEDEVGIQLRDALQKVSQNDNDASVAMMTKELLNVSVAQLVSLYNPTLSMIHFYA